MQKHLSTRFSIVSRSKGGSAIDEASYIGREELHSDYDSITYRPKANEDLVHFEINLRENAPAEYKDRATLWNAVEKIEKSKKLSYAGMKKGLCNVRLYGIRQEAMMNQSYDVHNAQIEIVINRLFSNCKSCVRMILLT